MIQQGADDWMKVVNKYLEIDEISLDSLLSFFSPLEDFIDEQYEDFQYKAVTAKESELYELEKKLIMEINATTTNAPPTTTIATSKQTIKKKTEIIDRKSPSRQDDKKSDINIVTNSSKELKFKSPIYEQVEKPENRNPLEPVTTEAPFDQSLDTQGIGDDNKPKTNTSKAAWAVGAVLIGIIVICIIAIFGRQRCRKVPKNRRYV